VTTRRRLKEPLFKGRSARGIDYRLLSTTMDLRSEPEVLCTLDLRDRIAILLADLLW
jgi:hypothetical protein